jgi:hypothetical protein
MIKESKQEQEATHPSTIENLTKKTIKYMLTTIIQIFIVIELPHLSATKQVK